MRIIGHISAVVLLLSTSCQQHERIESPTDKNQAVNVIDVLKKTNITNLDWPEQSIKDRLVIIREEASKVGVAVEWSDEVDNSERRWKSLRIRNISFLEAIRFMMGGTVLVTELRDPNILHFQFISEDRSSNLDLDRPINPDYPDPFDPRHHDPFTPK